jgi:YD repeat-containing protein
VSPQAWTTTYGTGGQVRAATQGNGNTTTSTHDATGRELARTTRTGSTSRAAYTWTYNRAGLVLSEASTITGDPSNGTVAYAYDPLGRLTTSGATAYTWDAATNRTGSGSSTTAFDAANRPTSGTSPTAAYTSDPDGRLTARPGQTMTWDHLGRLTSVTTASGTTTYAYDPLDRLRTVTVPGGAVTRFRYTGLSTSAAQLLDGTGTVTRNIGNGLGGERLLDWIPGTPATDLRYHGTNAHHDTTWLADSAGAVSSSLRYDPWGVPRSAVPALSRFRARGA